MEEFKNRLLTFVDNHLKVSHRYFESACNLSVGTLATIKVKGPSVNVLMKISNTYPELNLDWLITGRGSMLISNTKTSSPPVNIENIQTIYIGNWGEFLGPITEQMNNLCDAINNKI